MNEKSNNKKQNNKKAQKEGKKGILVHTLLVKIKKPTNSQNETYFVWFELDAVGSIQKTKKKKKKQRTTKKLSYARNIGKSR